MKVGWIGLGAMGRVSAGRIAAAGYPVTGYDVAPPAAGDLPGVRLAASARQAAADCDLLCVAVFSDAQVEEVLYGAEGVADALKRPCVVAIFTTGEIEAARSFSARAPAGVSVLDTCFSRRSADGDQRLTLLVGGEAEALEQVRPVLGVFSREILHLGGAGAGRAIKLVNNILFAAHIRLAAEALEMARAFGLDPRASARALNKCSGASEVVAMLGSSQAASAMQHARRYMQKDVAAALTAARAAGADLDQMAQLTPAALDQLFDRLADLTPPRADDGEGAGSSASA